VGQIAKNQSAGVLLEGWDWIKLRFALFYVTLRHRKFTSCCLVAPQLSASFAKTICATGLTLFINRNRVNRTLSLMDRLQEC
jgi:hypothetical protein